MTEPIPITLPPEPPHTLLIEALGEGLVEVTWQSADGMRWIPTTGRRVRRPEDWANIVEAALRNRWAIQVRKPWVEVKPVSLQEQLDHALQAALSNAGVPGRLGVEEGRVVATEMRKVLLGGAYAAHLKPAIEKEQNR